jgi:SAM-dependent methyltransferase
VLDFGAGPGHLVRALREMDVAADGIEPASTPRAAAATRHGIELHEGLAELAGRHYDAVVMLHTLEHVDDPAAVLRELLSIVSPGGSIFIEVPHAGGTGIWRADSRERMLDLPLHLYHFTPKTLKRLVGNVGGEVIDVRLSNCSQVEWMLAARATRAARPDETRDPLSPSATEVQRPSRTQRAWRSGVLPALRVLLAGDSFQLIARRAGASLPTPRLGAR